MSYLGTDNGYLDRIDGLSFEKEFLITKQTKLNKIIFVFITMIVDRSVGTCKTCFNNNKYQTPTRLMCFQLEQQQQSSDAAAQPQVQHDAAPPASAAMPAAADR